MTIAFETARHTDTFTAAGRTYRWVEGVVDPRAERLRGRREALRAAFERTVIPGFERRGVAATVRGAGPRGGASRAQWVIWNAPDVSQPVWALYVPTRRSGLSVPANEASVLAAWGDGPVIAWVSDQPALREALREALHHPPTFLAAGIVSGDASFPLKVTEIARR